MERRRCDSPLDRLHEGVSGAIERGEAQPIVAIDAQPASNGESVRLSFIVGSHGSFAINSQTGVIETPRDEMLTTAQLTEWRRIAAWLAYTHERRRVLRSIAADRSLFL